MARPSARPTGLSDLASALLSGAQAVEAAIRARDWREVNRLSELARRGVERLQILAGDEVPAEVQPVLRQLYEQNRRNALLLRHTLAHVRYVLELITGSSNEGYGPTTTSVGRPPATVGLVDRRI